MRERLMGRGRIWLDRMHGSPAGQDVTDAVDADRIDVVVVRVHRAMHRHPRMEKRASWSLVRPKITHALCGPALLDTVVPLQVLYRLL